MMFHKKCKLGRIQCRNSAGAILDEDMAGYEPLMKSQEQEKLDAKM